MMVVKVQPDCEPLVRRATRRRRLPPAARHDIGASNVSIAPCSNGPTSALTDQNELAEDLAGDFALEAADDLSLGQTVGGAPGEVVPGRLMVAL
jgi:hypothetical protein